MGEPEQNENEQNDKLFNLTEAERTRRDVEPLLIDAMENRRKQADLAESLSEIINRILVMGGIQIPLESAARQRREHDHLAALIKAALERIESTGCVVKDLDVGLLDFPARIGGEDVYLCWRLGEDRIRFYHRQDEGFAGRRPLDPRDRDGGAVQ
jgi:hypothetical protein